MEKLKILNRILPDYTERFLQGEFKLEEMPLLEAIGKRFKDKLAAHDLSSHYIIACQHLLYPQYLMFKQFIELGMPAANILILPKIYSANKEMTEELIKLGCTVFLQALDFHPLQNFDEFHREQCKAVVAYAHTHVLDSAKVILLDDGGMLISAFIDDLAVNGQFKDRIAGVEQTASGKRILMAKELPMVVTSVASSVEKIEIETDYIIRHAVKRMVEYFNEHTVPLSAKILVLGLGPIGTTTLDWLTKRGYDCIGYDIAEKGNVPALGDYDVVIGATGSNSIAIGQLPLLKEKCHLISISSSDREFPSVHIRNNALSGSKVHDTYVYSKKQIHLANGGFPITFKGERYECYPLEIDVTMMKLAEAIYLHAVGKPDIAASVNDLYGMKLYKSVTIVCLMIVVPFLALFSGFRLATFKTPEASPAWFYYAAIFVLTMLVFPTIVVIRYYRRVDQKIKK